MYKVWLNNFYFTADHFTGYGMNGYTKVSVHLLLNMDKEIISRCHDSVCVCVRCRNGTGY